MRGPSRRGRGVAVVQRRAAVQLSPRNRAGAPARTLLVAIAGEG